jgi:hypothetical protein
VPLAVPKSAARPTLKPKSDQPGDSSSTAVGGAKTNGTEAAKPAGEANVGLSLLCQSKQQVGKPFIVVVSVNSNATMTAASLALKFDPALLQLKAVRDGGLLGNHAEIKHQVQGGNLVISLQQAADKAAPASANGKLVVIEFTALGAGQTSIEINGAETNLTLGGNLSAQITATPARLQISREAVSLLNY